MTVTQKSALKWLLNRNGDGLFDKNGVLIAAGERAPVMRATWNKLEAAGLVELYLNRKRLKATDAGRISMNEFATSRDVKFSVDDSLPRRAAE